MGPLPASQLYSMYL